MRGIKKPAGVTDTAGQGMKKPEKIPEKSFAPAQLPSLLEINH
jgi:hypothetical protein